ncbi:MAG: hypothetical protein HY077_11585 [Elusimicrobia bacterium]|nr:hypothetical protein [Elusimicrobiota bacterium]
MTGGLPVAVLAAALCSCVTVSPEDPKTVGPSSVEDRRLAAMVQTGTAGALRIDLVVYKPKLYPLSGLLERLARGEFKKAMTRTRLRYNRSNIDDKALETLIKHGFIPVLVRVTNDGDKTADARGLTVSLEDDDFSLAALPNARLPEEFSSLNPKAVAANAYNTTVVVVGTLTVLAAIAGEIWLEARSKHSGDFQPVLPLPDIDMSVPVFNPVTKETRIDYNGLLFHPGLLRAGESARGLLFFKAKGVDWSALTLQASLPQGQ